MKILAVAGSMRAGSFNKKLLAVAVGHARALGAEVDVVDLKALALPLYDGDLEAEAGLPAGAVEFRERIRAADAILVATPEYNWSIPGTFKNAIDWVSRPPSQPLFGKVAALMGASPGGFGAVRSIGHLRQVLVALGVLALPGQITVSAADKAFGPDGALLDPKLDALVQKHVQALITSAGKVG